jgi:hypothetical protein
LVNAAVLLTVTVQQSWLAADYSLFSAIFQRSRV